MRIIQAEKIILSQSDITIIEHFQELMDGIRRGTSESTIEEIIDNILGYLNDLHEEIRWKKE